MDSKLRVGFSVAGSSETIQAPTVHSAAAPAKELPVTIETTKDYSTVYDNVDEDSLKHEFLETSQSFNESGHSVASDVADIVKGQLEEMNIDGTPKTGILCRGPLKSNQKVQIYDEITNHIIGSDHEGKNLISVWKL
uniref:Late embryogenesis abundant protein n=1 Tax=Panagrolaimus sp. PS1159 TaxID=55785 RepID=A0AC35EXD1_9BILA